MKKIDTKKAPKPVGPYSQAVIAENLIFVSGQIGINPETGNLKESVEEQTEQIFLNIDGILEAAKSDRSGIVKMTIYLTNINDFSKVNKIYNDFFKECRVFPARATVEVSNLPLNAKVEMECIAVAKK